MMAAIRSSEASFVTRATRRHFQEDSISQTVFSINNSENRIQTVLIVNLSENVCTSLLIGQ
jgi:hypothetical protein